MSTYADHLYRVTFELFLVSDIQLESAYLQYWKYSIG